MYQNKLCAVFVLMLSFILGFCCSKNSSDPVGPDDGDNGGNTARETISKEIGVEGAAIVLSNGISVVFPANAVNEKATFTIRDMDPAGYGEEDSRVTRVVVNCTGDVTSFNKPVELRVPLSEDMSEADSTMIFGGYIDEADGAKEMIACSVRTINGTLYAVLPMEHFSGGFIEWLVGKTPPASAGPFEMPYYGQGESKYCWAASLQMVSQAASFETRNEITEIIGKMGVDESGISSYQFRMNSTISSIIKSRTGVTPDRCSWDAVNCGIMKDYLKREIGVRGYPVAVHSTVWAHAVVVVGYDGNTFYIHDPASTSTSAVGYTTRTWDDMVKGMGSGEFMVCLSIPKSLDAGRPQITVNLMNGAFQFNRPPTDDDQASRIYKYRWDYEKEDGYGYLDLRDNKTVDVLPGEITILKQGGDIEIVNSSRTTSHEISLWLDIVCLTQKGAYFSTNERFTVAPNSTKRYTFSDIPVDEFRWNSENSSAYSFIVRALTDGTLVEEESVQFSIATRPVVIKSMTPERGAANTVVTLKGSGFGSIPKFTNVTFNGVEAEVDQSIWSDTEIKVLVPAKAVTGPVNVKNGDVTGSAGTFTVTKDTTVSNSLTFQTTPSFGDLVMTANVSYSLTGEIYDSWGGADAGNYYGHDVKIGSAISLTISGSASLDAYTREVTESNGDISFYTYHEPKMVPLTDTEYENWPLEIDGDYDCTVSDSGVSFTFDDLKDRLVASIVFEVTYDYERYNSDGELVQELKDQFYNSRTIGIISISAE
ncbi:MAG: IPT/TIG domain-containing protein [Candidatus Latescibacteria bacterium]|nr:IPT/TIG domain-containing protein [Candidatus Latescibacterota bacterium]